MTSQSHMHSTYRVYCWRGFSEQIMLNWVMLVVGLVFSASAFRNPILSHGGHRHRCAQDQDGVESVVNETAGDVSPQYQAVTDTECNVTGTWYNNLGSELIVTSVHEETGHVSGEYRTAVERKRGTAGTAASRVSGWTSSDGSHKSVVFSVLWNGGTSATAWTGLCHVCNGVEIMKTTWVLTHEVDTCDDHWSANRIGQDEFTRIPEVPGPRRHLNLHTPSDFVAVAERFREGVLSQDRQGNSKLPSGLVASYSEKINL